MSLGFNLEDAKDALKLCDGNIENAVNLLLEGDIFDRNGAVSPGQSVSPNTSNGTSSHTSPSILPISRYGDYYSGNTGKTLRIIECP